MAYAKNLDELLDRLQKMSEDYAKFLKEGADYFVVEENENGFEYDDGKLLMEIVENQEGGYDLTWRTETYEADSDPLHLPNIRTKEEAYKEFREAVESYWGVRLTKNFKINDSKKLAEKFKKLDKELRYESP